MKSEFFETIKVKDSIAYNLKYHQKRYEGVLKYFGVSDFKVLSDHIKPPDSKLYRCRLTYTPQEIIKVEYVEYEKRDIKSLKIVYDEDIDYSLKSTDRSELDAHFQNRGSCDDIVIVRDGLITDTSIANIALYDGVWKTPKSPLLKGTTRHRLLDDVKIIKEDIKVDDLKNFSKVALLNAMVDFDIIADENIKDVFC